MRARPLNPLACAVGSDGFDGGDRLTRRGGDWRDARARRLPVELNRAGAAQPTPAADLVPVHAQHIAQRHNSGMSSGSRGLWRLPFTVSVTMAWILLDDVTQRGIDLHISAAPNPLDEGIDQYLGIRDTFV